MPLIHAWLHSYSIAGLTLTWSKKLARLFSSLGGGDNSIESVMSSANDPEVEVHVHENSEPKFYSPTSHNNGESVQQVQVY